MHPATRILYLDYTNSIGLGGGQRSLSILVHNLDRGRFEPMVAVPPGEKILELISPEVARFELPLSGGFRGMSRNEVRGWRALAAGISALPAAVAVRRLALAQKVKLIHANNLKMLLLAAAACPGLPRFWHVRDIFPFTPAVRGILALASRLSTRIISVSEAVREHLPASRRNRVLYNAVDLPEPAATEKRRDRGRQMTVGFVGRLDHWKGLPVLLEAFAQARRRHPGTKLLVVGDGPEADRISGDGVERLGFRSDLSAVWPRIDIAVVPSTEPDPFPRSVIEAMGWAKPVVGSAIGGIPEAIEDGRTGFLFEPGSAAAAGERLIALLDEPRRAMEMGQAGRERCRRLFSAGAQARRMESIYEEVLAE
ncbi:MAG: glycosyltransferase family 4 protein [Bryobacteraceae bacterium]